MRFYSLLISFLILNTLLYLQSCESEKTNVVSSYNDGTPKITEIITDSGNLIKQFYESGTLNQQYLINNHDTVGSHLFFWENGNKQAVRFFSLGKKIKTKCYNKSGQLTRIIYNKDSGNYLNEFYRNGKLIQKGTYNGDLKEGEFYYYDSTGTVYMKETYKNNQLNGQTCVYWPSGKLKIETYYNDGVKDSIVKEFYKNGLPKLTVPLNYGHEHGTAYFYDSTGKQIDGRIFNNGVQKK